MRLYKMQINIALLDIGDVPDTAEPESAEKHPMLVDPQERQEEMLKRAERIVGIFSGPTPSGAGNTIRLSETYDVPTGNFSEAMDVLAKFHELGNKLGMPSTSPVNMPLAYPSIG